MVSFKSGKNAKASASRASESRCRALNNTTIAGDWRIHLHNLASDRRHHCRRCEESPSIFFFFRRTGLANEYFSMQDKWTTNRLNSWIIGRPLPARKKYQRYQHRWWLAPLEVMFGSATVTCIQTLNLYATDMVGIMSTARYRRPTVLLLFINLFPCILWHYAHIWPERNTRFHIQEYSSEVNSTNTFIRKAFANKTLVDLEMNTPRPLCQ